jgi:hypothetical protein
MIKPNFLPLPVKQSPKTPEINRLLTAAVINRQFRIMLLCDPASAAETGYEGESFRLDHKDKEKISAIHASSLREFAAQLAAI